MASRTTVELVDDVDGTSAVETVAFGVDGEHFEIDLSVENANALREAYTAWVNSARRVAGRPVRGATQVATEVDARAVRAWAGSHGVELSPRGRIPAHVIEQFRAAGN